MKYTNIGSRSGVLIYTQIFASPPMEISLPHLLRDDISVRESFLPKRRLWTDLANYFSIQS